jgi:hypothetical protein
MSRYALLVSLILSLLSCNKVDELTHFTIESDTESVIGLNLPVNLPTPVITTNIQQEMEENNSHKNLIESAYLTVLELAINSPESSNFNFLNQIEISIYADGFSK